MQFLSKPKWLFLKEVEKSPKIHMEFQSIMNHQDNLEKEKQSQKPHSPDFKHTTKLQ